MVEIDDEGVELHSSSSRSRHNMRAVRDIAGGR
jgi:hypothetical protein